MGRPAGGGPLRWWRDIVRGLYRSAVLTGLTWPMPAVSLGVGLGGFSVVRSWSEGVSGPLAVRALVALGQVALVVLWIAVALWIVHALTSRPLARAARRCAERWLGVRLEVTYRAVPQVSRMSTGYWWDGHEYHRSEREARRRAKVHARFHDPQLHWDGLWSVVAGVTVLPVAALPLLCLAGGVYTALTPGLLGSSSYGGSGAHDAYGAHSAYGVALIVAGVAGVAGMAGAPFAWRIFGPLALRFLGPVPRSWPGRRVEELEAIRADLTLTQAAELERIERDLHDGTQARLLALGMSVGAAEQLVDTDPAAAKAILAEARTASAAALAELRSLVHGINPPVLAERGLVDAVRALALDSPVGITVHSTVPSRVERPVESAVYFAVAELMANAAKHAGASRVSVAFAYEQRTLSATVTDDGAGGAAASAGSGLRGIERRMAAFHGRLEIDSPTGGPTHITVAVPCALS
ncbi:putative two-component histidine kinase [Streptomyces sp. NBRC 110611]|uniref:sensor histidine kinase n=1 Tax=Streptomyces sp. NBRC 110611 TaxID=1621259 RepID=UPI0008559318|nr:histidine kinase [Streptomyces sp. NBRC 110611]GAU68776.1 putative two-component histidine kinase [Streptomyces sp. NBRC 110611]